MKQDQKSLKSLVNSRKVAIAALIEINEAKAYANLYLPNYFEKQQVPLEIRAFVTELVYGSLRWQGWYDYLVAEFSDRSFNQIDNRTLAALRIGTHQLIGMNVENYAAVNETVSAAIEILGKARSTFINAMLRKISQCDIKNIEEEKLSELNIKNLSIRYSHPEWIVSAYFDVLKDLDLVKSLLIANNHSTKPDLVCWPTKSSLSDLVEATDFEPILGTKYGFTTKSIPSDLEIIRNRQGAVQDRASQKIVEIIIEDFDTGLNWLDMCAGPGGKAAYLYYSLCQRETDPKFLAYEVSEHRAALVKQVLPSHLVKQVDSRELPVNQFDRIILDAPCTGLGALRRRPEARWAKAASILKELIPLQRSLLNAAGLAVRKSGFIYYITCSPHKAETESMVHEFLIDHPDFKLIPIGSGKSAEDGYHRSWTHKGEGDSMFMAKLQRVN